MSEMGSSDAITLRAGPLEMLLSPCAGGSISHLDWVGQGARIPVLRRCNSLAQNALEAGNFPLVPFVNRIRGGVFHFRGRDVALAPNMAGDRSPLHGQGWLSPWRVEQVSQASALLSFDHPAGEWPWSYAARQSFALDATGLTLSLSCRNSSPDPMPCGLGQHPYFNCGPATRLDTRADHVWTIDEDVLPVDRIPATGRFDLADRLVCGQDLDHGFDGWGGSARMTDPDWPFAITMSSPTANFFQLYSPASGGIFVAEPVTHANAALNAPEADWPRLGMRVLEPGEEMILAMRIEVTPV